MTIRTKAALVALCLSLAMAPGAAAAADPAASGAARPATEPAPEAATGRAGERSASESAEPEPAHAVPPALAQAPGPDADETEEESAEGGLLSRIVEWLRSDGAEAHPRPAAEAEAAPELVTLGDVHRAIRDMTAEIGLLRKARGVADPPREADPREDLAPVHVRVKLLEVFEKTARVQRRLGMIPAETGHASVSRSAPSDLHDAVGAVVGELRRIKRQLVVEAVIEPASSTRATTPSALYDELAHASSLLDALVGRPPTLNDALVRITRVHGEMRAIAARLGAALDTALDTETPPAAPARTPREVAQQLLRATYKAVSLQTALGMEASGVPAASLAHADGAVVLDAANLLLAELVRIRMHLGVEAPSPEREPPDGPPADAFTQALRAVSHLDAMIRAAADAS